LLPERFGHEEGRAKTKAKTLLQRGRNSMPGLPQEFAIAVYKPVLSKLPISIP